MSNISGSLATMSIIFALFSICICVVQILIRKKIDLLSFCKVSTIIPIIYIFISILSGVSKALRDIAPANDLSGSVLHEGLAYAFESIIFGLIVTIILFLVYATTVTIYKKA
jgi:hypothetical protein